MTLILGFNSWKRDLVISIFVPAKEKLLYRVFTYTQSHIGKEKLAVVSCIYIQYHTHTLDSIDVDNTEF